MRVLFIQHDHVSPYGPVGERFIELGHEVSVLRVVPEEQFKTPNVHVDFPAVGEYDVIVPMGAPWGAWDDEGIGNWLLPEIEYLKSCHNAGTRVLGLCFGGQLMARALGGSVTRAPSHEIGYTYIYSDDESLVPNGPWFQWHHDRFDPPPGAAALWRSKLKSPNVNMTSTAPVARACWWKLKRCSKASRTSLLPKPKIGWAINRWPSI